LTLALQNMWQNHRAEAAEDASYLWAEFFLEDCGAWMRCPRRSRAEAVTHGVLSGNASRLQAMLTPRAAVPGERLVSRAHDMSKLCSTRVLLLSLHGEKRRPRALASCRRLTEQTERRGNSASPHNGSDVKLRGQGPRGYGSAARRLPACEARDAGGVTPRSSR